LLLSSGSKNKPNTKSAEVGSKLSKLHVESQSKPETRYERASGRMTIVSPNCMSVQHRRPYSSCLFVVYFKNIVSNFDYIVSNEWMIVNWKKYGSGRGVL
jgi:hypothetical protein